MFKSAVGPFSIFLFLVGFCMVAVGAQAYMSPGDALELAFDGALIAVGVMLMLRPVRRWWGSRSVAG